MSKYQHLLLAADYSEHGDYVVARAASLAAQFQAKLSIVHVLDNIAMPQIAYGTVLSLEEKSTNEELENEKIKLLNFADKHQVDSSDCYLVWGLPKHEIVQIAEAQGVDLIVIGSHGRHGVALLLGSTANAVLHYAKCDVLAVRLPNN